MAIKMKIVEDPAVLVDDVFRRSDDGDHGIGDVSG